MTSLTSYDAAISARTPTPPKLVSFEQIEQILTNLLSSPRIVESQAVAFRLASASHASPVATCSNLPIQTVGQVPNPPLRSPTAQMCIKTGYAAGDAVIVSKVAAGGGSASNTGCVMVYSQETLRLECVLCDEGLLTEVRTAAAGLYATKSAIVLARRRSGSKVRKIGLVGGGVQAVWQLRLLFASGLVDPSHTNIVVRTTSRESAEEFVRKMNTSAYAPDRELRFEMFDEERRFKDCQVLYTLTPSREVILHEEDVTLPNGESQPFLHITAVGSDSPGKSEVSTKLLEKADVCLTDLIGQSRERGEFQSSRWDLLDSDCPNLLEIGSEGVVDESSGMLVADRCGISDGKLGLFTVFDSSGLAMQDVQMAKLVFQHL